MPKLFRLNCLLLKTWLGIIMWDGNEMSWFFGFEFCMEKCLSKPTDKSTFVSWIHGSISDLIIDAIPDNENVKSFVDAIGERDLLSLIKLKLDLMGKLMNMRYDDTSIVREHIIKMINMSSKLKALKIPIAELFLVHHVLNSLSSQFNRLKIAYNA